jgi:predicted peptidase
MPRKITCRVLTIMLSLVIGPVAAAVEPVADAHAPLSEARRAMMSDFWQASEGLASRFDAHTHDDGRGNTLPYRLFVPDAAKQDDAGGNTGEGADADTKYPLVIFLHGAGGRGTDNEAHYTRGNTFGTHIWIMPEHQAKWLCFVVAPQTDQSWTPREGDDERFAPLVEEPDSGLTPTARMVLELVEALAEEYPIDTDRLIITGQSMGGGGVWYLLTRCPDMFAAAIPVCGIWAEPAIAPAIAHVPLWIFHGEQDRPVPVDVSRAMVEALKAAGGNPAYTEYAGVGHDSWGWAYTEPALVPWAMAQRRSPR